jgi:hypothetical protein
MHAISLYFAIGAGCLLAQTLPPSTPSMGNSTSSSDDSPAVPYYPDPLRAPAPKAKPVKLAVSPSTIREGYDYKGAIKTILTLSHPAPGEITYHVVSSDLKKVTCTDITFKAGETEARGTLKVNWAKIERDGRIRIKVVDPDDVLATQWTSVNLRRDSSRPFEEEASEATPDRNVPR